MPAELQQLIADFHFLRPWWLLALLFALILPFWLWQTESRRSSWQNVIDRELLNHLLTDRLSLGGTWPRILSTLVLILAVLALAGPTFQQRPQQTHRSDLARVFLFDLSLSMSSTDIKPDRLSRARFKLRDFIEEGKGLQQGLIVFAGDAFVVAPLTDDHATLINLVQVLDTRTVPVQGSRPDLALDLASELFQSSGFDRGQIILLTDGASDVSGSIQSARLTAESGFPVSVVSAGTARGEPVPLTQGGFLKDLDGNIVIPSVDFDALRSIADAGRGVFQPMTLDDTDIKSLMEPSPETAETSDGSHRGDGAQFFGDRWYDLGPWLLIPLLAGFCCLFRKGLYFSLTLVGLAAALHSSPSIAFSWMDLWLRDDQQAARALEEEDYEAASGSDSAHWRGAAQFRAGQYEAAARSFAQQTDELHLYNRGNALAKAGEVEQAVSAYEELLSKHPDHEDARFNLDLLKQYQSQQDQQQSSQDQSKSSSQPERDEQKQGANDDENSRSEEDEFRQQQSEKSSADASSQAGDSENSDDNSDEETPSSEQRAETQNQSDMTPTEKSELTDEGTMSEQQQALQQWLRQIPDDPGGLLRRKFAQQYQFRPRETQVQKW
ncbi:MAG: VWA domain-containing protein [Pseudomonadota bacterium]